MKYPFIKCNSYLPEKTFEKLLYELPSIEKVSQGVRSHKDIHVQDDLFKSIPTWQLFAKSIHSGRFWVPFLGFLNHENLQEQFSFDKYNCDFIEPRSGAFRSKDLFFYSRIDIGYGIEGYGAVNGGRGVHIDMPQRLISALLYFSDQKDFEGGEFLAYDKDKKLTDKVEIKPNMLIASIQNENAWHAVNPIVKCKKPRIAAYMALSCSRNIWINR